MPTDSLVSKGSGEDGKVEMHRLQLQDQHSLSHPTRQWVPSSTPFKGAAADLKRLAPLSRRQTALPVAHRPLAKVLISALRFAPLGEGDDGATLVQGTFL